LRQAIRRAKKLNPGAVIAVCGCFTQADAAAARELGADYVGGAGERMRVVEFLYGALRRKADLPDSPQMADPISVTDPFSVPDPFARREFEELPAGEAEGRTRALLKVQDGCVNFCSYCIIPYLRGPSRSLPIDAAENSVIDLASKGFAEIVITGIEISSYGADIGSSLTELVERLCKAAPGARFRLGSLEPTTVTRDFADRLSKLPNLCPHFHLSLQSGNADVLKRMRRKYTPEQYAEAVSLLRSAFSDPAITTDLIVGFPGETEEEFRETLGFIRSVGFAAMHIFPYSKREGTRAAEMPGHMTNAVKEARAAEAVSAAGEMKRAYLDRQTGCRHAVLFETEKDGFCEGHTENYLLASVPGTGLRGKLLTVGITGNDGEMLFGEICDDQV
jgi:threonylcarbamoyladenosine tRNA methylthiotransferase MtaB